MIISDDQIRQIADTISAALGPAAPPEEIKRLAEQIVARLTESEGMDAPAPISAEPSPETPVLRFTKKLVINALGPDRVDLGEKLNSFVAGRALNLTAISDTPVERLRSLVAIVDCTDYAADTNRLKFELASLCEDFGFRALVQDIDYYGL